MSNQKAHWEELFRRYKASGLSQPEFCKQNNISTNQFQYRWYERNKALKVKTPVKAFEPISVVSTTAMTSAINLSIYLPNQIRCEVTTDLNGFSPILSQLVQLC
jgi:hypothetical protein